MPLPAIIGHDISGVIEEVGSHVTEFRAGDAVYYTPQIFGGPGSYAEQHVADVDLVGRKPENLSHLEAASLTLVGGTVWESPGDASSAHRGGDDPHPWRRGRRRHDRDPGREGDRRTSDHHREEPATTSSCAPSERMRRSTTPRRTTSMPWPR